VTKAGGEVTRTSRSVVAKAASKNTLHSNLGMLLSRQLAEMHGGQITVQGSPESGYRYLISLPQTIEGNEGV
jgi:signal transduction histidine kinase